LAEKLIACVTCPKECALKVSLKNGKIEAITGNGCKRGITYAEDELFHPKRIITTTVLAISKDNQTVLPVRSNIPMAKDLLLKAMDIIKETIVAAPIKRGDVIIENILNSGVDIIAAKTINVI
jgi:CxxC motif-containing protein